MNMKKQKKREKKESEKRSEKLRKVNSENSVNHVLNGQYQNLQNTNQNQMKNTCPFSFDVTKFILVLPTF